MIGFIISFIYEELEVQRNYVFNKIYPANKRQIKDLNSGFAVAIGNSLKNSDEPLRTQRARAGE